jgi:two-component system, NtrC family, sensor kinase
LVASPAGHEIDIDSQALLYQESLHQEAMVIAMALKKLRRLLQMRSISFRLHLFVVVTMVLTVLAVSYFDSRVSVRMMDDQIRRNAAGDAAHWATELSRREPPLDAATLQSWLRISMESEPYIVRADVYRLSGGNLKRFATTSGIESQTVAFDEIAAVKEGRTRTAFPYGDSERFVKIAVPFVDRTGTRGCVSVLASLNQSDDIGKIHGRIAYLLVPGSVLLSVILLHFLLTRLLVRRFNRLIAAMNAARRGDLAIRAPAGREDEIGIIAQRFNEMMDQIELASSQRDRLLEEQKTFNTQLQEKVREATEELSAANQKLRQVNEELVEVQRRLTQSERTAVAGQMAATFAHEIGSPLSAISTHLQLMAEDPALPEDTQQRLTLVQDQVSRIAGFVEELLSEARLSMQTRSPVQLNQILRQLLFFLEQHLAKCRIKVETKLSPDLPTIEANPQQLQQVFLNLLNNACDAMPEGGKVCIETSVKTEGDGTYVAASIADDGIGIPEEKQGHIFEPFFTTKDLHRGTGLGLSIAARIVRQYNGTIELLSAPGAGARFTIRFPASRFISATPQDSLYGKDNS